MAMNIISKEKKEIKWIGLPTNSAQECQNLEVGFCYIKIKKKRTRKFWRLVENAEYEQQNFDL